MTSFSVKAVSEFSMLPTSVSTELVASTLSRRRIREGSGRDEFDCRDLVQLRGRGLVFTHWQEIEAVATALETKTTLLGAHIRRIIADAQVRKAKERDRLHGIRTKPISREEALARMTPKGRRAVLGSLAVDGKTRIERR